MEKKNYSERQLVVFHIGSEEFGVDINQVREIIKVEEATKIPNSDSYLEGIINLRGKIIAVMDLAKKLGLPIKAHDKNSRIIVTEVEGTTLGILVDSCNEVIRVNANSIEEAPDVIANKIDTDFIEGVSILDKRLVVLLNLAKILKDHELKKIKEAQEKHTSQN